MFPGRFFLHVGVHKTATTWFQTEVYPRFEGAQYLHNPPIHKLISLSKKGRYILCEEALLRHFFGRSHHDNLPLLSKLFPEAQIILSLRKQSSWLKSAYSYYIKKGGILDFEDFFDIKHNSGIIKRNDLFFREIIEDVNSAFSDARAWVILFDHIQRQPSLTVRNLARRMGCYVDLSSLDFTPRNSSISSRAGQLLLQVNPYIKSGYNPQGSLPLRKPWLKKLGLLPEQLVQFPIAARLGSAEPLVDPDILDHVDQIYADDWAWCMSYALNTWGEEQSGHFNGLAETRVAWAP